MTIAALTQANVSARERSIAGSLSPEHTEALLKSVRDNPLYPRIDVRYLSEEERTFLLEHERKQKEEFGVYNDELLLNLGDEKTMRKLAKSWNMGSTTKGEALQESGRPEVIPMIAPTLFLGEDYEEGGYDVRRIPHSFYTATVIRNLIKRSTVFSPEVLRWVQEIHPKTKEEVIECRQIFREWWKENEQHFQKKQYEAVKPGRGMPTAGS